MELSKKVAYLKGLMEGLKIDDSTNEGKILTIMADILDEMSATVEDIDYIACGMPKKLTKQLSL